MKKFYSAYVFTALAILSIILSTAHAEKAGLTTYKGMCDRLVSLQDKDAVGMKRLKLSLLGKSVKGRDILLVTVADPNMPIESTKRLFVICRQHGDEPASTEAMLNLVDDLTLSTTPETADLLTKVSFFIVPMVNPDGAEAYERRNANNADLNRDWLELKQPETKALCGAIDSLVPDVVIDAHELSPGNRSSDFVETVGLSGGVSPEVAEESEKIQNLVAGILRTQDMLVQSYKIEDRNPARLAHRFLPVHNGTKTILFETRQAGSRQYQLQYRMRLHMVGTMAVARYLAGQEEKLTQQIVDYDAKRWKKLASRSRKPAPKPAPGSKAK